MNFLINRPRHYFHFPNLFIYTQICWGIRVPLNGSELIASCIYILWGLFRLFSCVGAHAKAVNGRHKYSRLHIYKHTSLNWTLGDL